MRKSLLAFFLGLFSFFLMMFVGETVGSGAAFIWAGNAALRLWRYVGNQGQYTQTPILAPRAPGKTPAGLLLRVLRASAVSILFAPNPRQWP